MAHLSQRRDLSDPEIIARFAERVGDEERLVQLYLIAICDMAMTSPTNLSGWKDELLRELFLRARDALRRGAGDETDTSEARRRVRERVVAILTQADEAEPSDSPDHPRWEKRAVESLLEGADKRFLQGLNARQAARHIDLALRRRRDGRAVELAVIGHARRGSSELAIVAPDAPGVLAAIAGALTAHRVDVLGAVLGHADDGSGGRGAALDLFHVRDLVGSAIPADDARWPRLRADLEELLRDSAATGGPPDRQKVADLIARRRPRSGMPLRITPAVPTEVKIANDEGVATIVEVYTRDRVGVLYAITHTLADLGLDIHLAKVSTEGEKVADVFYVTRDGEKLATPELLTELHDALHAALGEVEGG
jgi:[protein-PII] uridylyltransferase